MVILFVSWWKQEFHKECTMRNSPQEIHKLGIKTLRKCRRKGAEVPNGSASVGCNAFAVGSQWVIFNTPQLVRLADRLHLTNSTDQSITKSIIIWLISHGDAVCSLAACYDRLRDTTEYEETQRGSASSTVCYSFTNASRTNSVTGIGDKHQNYFEPHTGLL